MEGLEDFYGKIAKIRKMVTGYRDAIVVFHDDADGISSAAIAKLALERMGMSTTPVCLEKTYPMVLEKLHSVEEKLFVYVDIGSAHADWISQYNNGRNLVIILDHHDPSPATDSMVLDLNLEYSGFRGESDFSGSVITYLFARILDHRNVDLSYLAVIGASEIPGGYVGLNRKVLEESIKNGTVRREGKKMIVTRLGVSVSELFKVLQILGAVGYYSGGPELGIKACTDGLTGEIRDVTNRLENRRKRINKIMLARLYRSGLRETKHIQWFDAGDNYKNMGTKVIGQFCSYLRYQARLVKPNKYLLGFMNMPRVIPGFGVIEGAYSKFSVRTPKELARKIEGGEYPPAVDVSAEASRRVGGFADGHAYAASGLVPMGRKMELLEIMDSIVEEHAYGSER